MRSGKGTQIMGEILASLAAYTQAHIADEERHMQQHGIPDFPSPKLHGSWWTGSAISGKPKTGVIVITQASEYLQGLVDQHIQGETSSIGPFMNERGVPDRKPPAVPRSTLGPDRD